MKDFKSLIDCIRKEEVTLFIGSGFSLKAGAPSSDSIVEAILNKMTKKERDGLKSDRQLNTIAEEFEEMYNRESLISILEDLMSFEPTNTTDHKNLTKIPHFHHIITTNYDTLIEDTYGKDNSYVVRTAEDCTNLPKEKVIIFKIHGDLINKNNIIITKQDYVDFFANQKEPLLWKYIQSEILTRDVLFIGYSLEDSNIFEIMKQIKDAVKGQTRHFFLIAPDLKEYKINKLAKTNVTYYNAKAEELFPQLFASLNKNIHADYRKKRVSFSTLSKYSHSHDLEAYASELKHHNKVEFKPTGKSDVQINFSIDKFLGDKLKSHDISIFNDHIPNSSVPALSIYGDNLKKFELVVNGMTIGTKDDFKCLFIAPAYEEKDVSFRIKEIGFNERTKIIQYTFNNKFILSAILGSFTFKLEITFMNRIPISCTCNVTFTENYEDNSDALKWINLPIALWENKELLISSFPNLPLKFPWDNHLYNFQRIKLYYTNIKEIEISYGIEFKEYRAYSPDALEKTELLIKSYNESITPVKMENKEFGIDVDRSVEIIRQEIPCKKDSCSLAMTQGIKEIIELNGHQFTLKLKYTIIQDCTILSISKIDKEKTRVKIRNNMDYIYFMYTDKDINELYNLKKV